MITSDDNLALLNGNAVEVLRTFASGTIRCCVTSPPYWALRRYIEEGVMKLREDLTPEQREYVLTELKKAGL